MRKKLSSVPFWLFIFVTIIAVEAYSSLSQDADISGYGKTGSVAQTSTRIK